MGSAGRLRYIIVSHINTLALRPAVSSARFEGVARRLQRLGGVSSLRIANDWPPFSRPRPSPSIRTDARAFAAPPPNVCLKRIGGGRATTGSFPAKKQSAPHAGRAGELSQATEVASSEVQLRPFSIEDLIMPVVDERRIAKARALRLKARRGRDRGRAGVMQGTVSVILRQHGLGGSSRWRTSGGGSHDLPTKLAIIGLGVTVLIVGRALILWRS